MNDELNQLERRLEQATSRQLPAGASLDSETASLREGWLALGHLLEAAEAASGPAAPLQPAPPSRPRRSWKVLGFVAAAAASLLVAGVLAWELFPGQDSGEHAIKTPVGSKSLEPAEPSRVREKTLVTPSGDLALASKTPANAAKTAKDTSWDGTVDESITKAYRELIRIEQDWTGFNGMSEPVSTKLEEMGQELAKNTI